MKKMFMGMVFLLCMIFTLCTALGDYSQGYFLYTVSDESVTITGYFGSESHVRVPSMIAGCPVNTIASGAFTNTRVTSVTLPDCVTKVEANAVNPGVRVVFDTGVTTARPTARVTAAPTRPARTPAPTARAETVNHEETEDELTADEVEAAGQRPAGTESTAAAGAILAAVAAILAVMPAVWWLFQ